MAAFGERVLTIGVPQNPSIHPFLSPSRIRTVRKEKATGFPNGTATTAAAGDSRSQGFLPAEVGKKTGWLHACNPSLSVTTART